MIVQNPLIVHRIREFAGFNLPVSMAFAAAGGLNLLFQHLRTDALSPPYRPVYRDPYNQPKGWSCPHEGPRPDALNFVLKIQRFQNQGYEAVLMPLDLSEIARLSDSPKTRVRSDRSEQSPELIEQSIQRSKRKVRHLIKSMGCDRLLTLTRREGELDEWYSQDDWIKAWKRFNRLLRIAGAPISYVAVLERHKKGNYHLHAAIVGKCNINLIRRCWYAALGQRTDGLTPGQTNIQFRQNCTPYQRRAGLAKYVSKYLTKQANLSEFNRKRYFQSSHELPLPTRQVLRAANFLDAVAEMCSLLSLDLAAVLSIGYQFKPDCLWINYDDRLPVSPPF